MLSRRQTPNCLAITQGVLCSLPCQGWSSAGDGPQQSRQVPGWIPLSRSTSL